MNGRWEIEYHDDTTTPVRGGVTLTRRGALRRATKALRLLTVMYELEGHTSPWTAAVSRVES